jgi:hypothetical protein
MLNARLYVDGSVLWALVQCAQCRDVHKYSMDEVILGPLVCRQCHREMDVRDAMRGAAAEWVETHPEGAAFSHEFLERLAPEQGLRPDAPAQE